MTSADLTERERNLEREQKAWRQEKVDLERAIQKLVAEKDYLKTAVGKTRTTLEGLQRGVQNLSLAETNLTEHNKTLTHENKALDKDNIKKASEFQILSSTISKLKSTIDQDVETYKAERLEETDTYVSEKSEALQKEIGSLINERDHIIDLVNTYKTTEEEWLQKIEIVKDNYYRAIKSFDTMEGDIKDKQTALTRSIDDLKTKETTLNESVANLAKVNRDLMAENTALRAYEDRAWTVLKAKDEELIAREQAIEEKEQYKPSRRSLLPPTEE